MVPPIPSGRAGGQTRQTVSLKLVDILSEMSGSHMTQRNTTQSPRHQQFAAVTSYFHSVIASLFYSSAAATTAQRRRESLLSCYCHELFNPPLIHLSAAEDKWAGRRVVPAASPGLMDSLHGEATRTFFRAPSMSEVRPSESSSNMT